MESKRTDVLAMGAFGISHKLRLDTQSKRSNGGQGIAYTAFTHSCCDLCNGLIVLPCHAGPLSQAGKSMMMMSLFALAETKK
jgi:hypothetical protein